jgi:hypothetical protein
MPDPNPTTKPEPPATPPTSAPLPPAPPTYRQRVVAFVTSAEGVQEHPIGSNAGPEVNQYLAAVGLGPGYAWCCAFAVWAQHHAAMHAGIPTPVPATGLCSTLFAWAKQHGKLVAAPHPGDIGLRKGGPRGHDHAVTVTARVPGNLVEAIAGNSSTSADTREGWIVAKHTYAMEELDFVSVSPEAS